MLLQDVRLAARGFRKTPGFTAVAVLTLTLSIGAVSAVFSLINAVLLRSLPVPRPDRLVEVATERPSGARGDASFPMFEEIARRQNMFSAVIGSWGDGVLNVETNGVLVRGDIWAVTGNFFAELGAKPHAGRLLTDEDVGRSRHAPAMVAVLGYGLWQREWAGDPAAIGRTVAVEGVPFTIVGVAPRGFTALSIETEPDVTIPLTAEPLVTGGTLDRLNTGRSFWVGFTGRLREGVTLEAARGALVAMWPDVQRATIPSDYAGRQRDEFLAIRLAVNSAARGHATYLRSRFTRPLYVVLAVAGVVLLIACINLASLMLSRTAARTQEMAVRTALGASRWRIARQLLTEGLLLSGAGAAGGLAFASWCSRAITRVMTSGYLVPVVLDVSPDPRVLAFTSTIAVCGGALFSFVPVWHAARHDAARALQQSGRSSTRTGRTGPALIATQVALSLVLLAAAGLLVRSLQELRAIDLGFRRGGILLGTLFPRPDGSKDLVPDRYYPELIRRVAELPGVQTATLSRMRPGGGFDWTQPVTTASDTSDDGVVSQFAVVAPSFFDAVGIRLLTGRDVAWTDRAPARRVAIVSRSLADRLFAGADATGRRIRVGADPGRSDLLVVGIVSDARLYDPHNPSRFAVYVPLLQESDVARSGELVVASSLGAAALAGPVRTAVQSMGRNTIAGLRPIQAVVDRAVVHDRVTGWLAGFFGALALLLAAIGLFGLMSYAVTHRRKELGIRLALGAEPRRILAAVVRDGVAITGIGLFAGSLIAIPGLRVMRSLVFGVTVHDPIALAAAPLLLLLVAVGACLGPAIRASRLDPIASLRDE